MQKRLCTRKSLEPEGYRKETLLTDQANGLNSNPGIGAPGLRKTQYTILDRD